MIAHVDTSEVIGKAFTAMLQTLPNTIAGKLLSLAAIWTVSYLITLAIYRLFFSQIAGFPGPKLAAATGWYEFYYDYWLNGTYIFEIERMHRKYGEFVPESVSIKIKGKAHVW